MATEILPPNRMTTRSRYLTIAALALAASACRSTAPTTAPRPTAQRPTPQLMHPLTTLSAHQIVPEPVSVTPGSGPPFTLTAATTITVPANDSGAARIGEMLGVILRPSVGLPFP